MKFYTLHVPDIEPGSLLPNGDRLQCQLAGIEAIKEGFCWPAFIFSMVWSLWHGLWLATLGLVATILGAGVLVVHSSADGSVMIVIFSGISVLLGFIGNDLRRAKLEWRGFTEQGIVLARTAEAAVRRYLTSRTGAR